MAILPDSGPSSERLYSRLRTLVATARALGWSGTGLAEVLARSARRAMREGIVNRMLFLRIVQGNGLLTYVSKRRGLRGLYRFCRFLRTTAHSPTRDIYRTIADFSPRDCNRILILISPAIWPNLFPPKTESMPTALSQSNIFGARAANTVFEARSRHRHTLVLPIKENVTVLMTAPKLGMP